ncbi:hypothetical protein [Pseudoxanthomonas putridarboris]|uniref:Uncharacterized protein n=1 Tax=Pseudoxanthomonas putridarboris TaxID=752605 RepID=A0ABU9IY71_9GAMM
MKLPVEYWKRAVLGATAAMALVLVLSWAGSRVLPIAWLEPLNTRLGYLSPLNYLFVAAGMAAGGLIAGTRFVPWAAALALVIWLATLAVLAGAVPNALDAPSPGLGKLVSLNLASILLTIAAAAAGALAGARWGGSRPNPMRHAP